MTLTQTTHSTLLANIDKIQRHAGPDALDIQEDHYRHPIPSRTHKRLDAGIQTLGEGLELWCGYFQSVHPTIGKNIDVSTAVMFKQGSFQTTALAVLKQNNICALDLCPDLPQFRQLKNFFKGVSVTLIHRLAERHLCTGPLPRFAAVQAAEELLQGHFCHTHPPAGRFQTAALAVLKQNNLHALDLCPDLPQFGQLKNFFKGVSVTLIHQPGLKKI
ncbi:hypothetical protein C8R48DRAFT_671823 [Suillus tomentosus]|nr:hypothetical protein C8R48DRAFT_671823 [Suillus tomentosus]